jgi:hypothetical protein
MAQARNGGTLGYGSPAYHREMAIKWLGAGRLLGCRAGSREARVRRPRRGGRALPVIGGRWRVRLAASH